jgi:hypothetical protein
MDFLVDGGRRRHPQKETAVYTDNSERNIGDKLVDLTSNINFELRLEAAEGTTR